MGRLKYARSKVLVVDDTEDNLLLMRALLSDSYDVETAGSGPEALALACGDTPPDLILLDIMMPGMDGYDVIQKLRAHPTTADVPIIFLTALTSTIEERFGLDLGAVDYITKPISPPILLARVHAHLERSLAERHLQSLQDKLRRYLAPQVYQSLFDGSRDAELRTQRKKLTVFFSDIKDFTASIARWEPEEIRFLLNSYFSEMSKIVADHGGTLDKFIGDAMVVFFGDPQSRGEKQDALQCVRMALAMQRRMRELQGLWRQLGADRTFRIRCGINTGMVDVGNFGSDTRMDYTVIGAEVNKAARLEQAAEPGGVLVSRSTWDLVRDEFMADEWEPLELKGFTERVPAFAITGEAHADETRKAFQWERLGMRVLADPDRGRAADRVH